MSLDKKYKIAVFPSRYVDGDVVVWYSPSMPYVYVAVCDGWRWREKHSHMATTTIESLRPLLSMADALPVRHWKRGISMYFRCWIHSWTCGDCPDDDSYWRLRAFWAGVKGKHSSYSPPKTLPERLSMDNDMDGRL